MTAKTSLLLHSSDVMALLEKNPEVMLGLQGIAAEKVAEEIKRKTQKDLASAEVDRLVRKAVADAENTLKHRWSFPKEAQSIVREIARETVAGEIGTVRGQVVNATKERCDEMVKEADRRIVKRLDEAKEAFSAFAAAELKRMARESFIEVMREVRESIK